MTKYDSYNTGLTLNHELYLSLDKHDLLPAIKLLGKLWADMHYVPIPAFVLKCENILDSASTSLSTIKTKGFEYIPSLNCSCITVNPNIITSSFAHTFTYNSFIRSIIIFTSNSNGVMAHSSSINSLCTLPYISESNVAPAWIIILLKLLNSTLFKMVIYFIGLYLISWLAGFSYIFNYLFALLGNRSNYHSISKRAINDTNVSLIMGILCNLSYVISYAFHDKLAFYNYVLKRPFFRQFLFNLLALKLSFAWAIVSAVMGSNGFWFYIFKSVLYDRYRIPLTFFTAICSIVFYNVWFWLGEAPNSVSSSNISINAVFRALSEALAFNCVAWNNYSLWLYYLGFFTNNSLKYSLAIALGSLVHILCSSWAIKYEIEDKHRLAYGVISYISFTAIAFATNAMVYYISKLHIGFSVAIFVISFFGTVGLNPITYRKLSDLDNRAIELTQLNNNRGYFLNLRGTIKHNNKMLTIIAVISYYFFVVSFVVLTYYIFWNTHIG